MRAENILHPDPYIKLKSNKNVGDCPVFAGNPKDQQVS
jgi:hypothetical protein